MPLNYFKTFASSFSKVDNSKVTLSSCPELLGHIDQTSQIFSSPEPALVKGIQV